VQIARGTYESIREANGHFLVSPGHEHGEQLAGGGQGYRVVVLAGAVDASADARPLHIAPAILPQAS
jgi:hypothetical protein